MLNHMTKSQIYHIFLYISAIRIGLLASPSTPHLFLLLLDPRQEAPDQEDGREQGEDDRLQHLHTLGLRNGADGERQERRTAAPKRGREPDGADVEMAREQLRHGHDGGGEQGADKEPLQSHRDGRDDELWDEPEQEFQAHGDG